MPEEALLQPHSDPHLLQHPQNQAVGCLGEGVGLFDNPEWGMPGSPCHFPPLVYSQNRCPRSEKRWFVSNFSSS